MIVPAGLGIESGSLSVQEEGADLALLNETVKVAVDRSEADPRQPSVHPPVDLMGERVGMIALESCEHLLQLTRCTFASRSPHSPTSTFWVIGRSERQWMRGTKSRVRCQPLFNNR
jgi:hypothetical protein